MVVSRQMAVFVSVVMAVFVLCLAAGTPALASNEVLALSIPYGSLRLEDAERIAAFEVDISGGQITSFANVPTGWHVCIHNDPNQTARIGGNAIVGSSFVDASFFKDFIMITTYGEHESPEIKVMVGTINNATQGQRSIHLKTGDIILSDQARKNGVTP
jgi:hypothetical protein